MNNTPRTHSEGRRLIAKILEPTFRVSALTAANTPSSFEPGASWEKAVFSWTSPDPHDERAIVVYIGPVGDGAKQAADIREMISTETMPGDEAAEIQTPEEGEYVFALGYLGRLTAIADRCQVDVYPSPNTQLTTLAGPALQIARTLGCSPLVDDRQPSKPGSSPNRGAWTTADGHTYDPRTPPAP